MMMHLTGAWPSTVGHAEHFFSERHINLDCRGPLTISSESNWGFYVTVITLSHTLKNGGTSFSIARNRPVIVDRLAWICSGALLYNCHIGEGAVVAAGTVVRSQEVKPWVMVAGNPAKVIARFVDGAWQYLSDQWEVLE